jgi:hypothetical protein
MSDIDRTRTVLIREDTPLPTTLSIKTEAVFPGWRIVKNLDRQALTREVERANWNFFYLAGEMRATVLRRNRVRNPAQGKVHFGATQTIAQRREYALRAVVIGEPKRLIRNAAAPTPMVVLNNSPLCSKPIRSVPFQTDAQALDALGCS